MKKLILILIATVFLAACGHTEIQKKYMQTQKELAKMKMKQRKPLVDIKTPEGYHITVQNPYKRDFNVQAPQKHPATVVWEDTVRLASSPLASVLGFGFAGKMLMKEAGDTYSAGGDMAGRDVTKPGGDMAGGDISGGDMSGGDMAGNDLSGDSMDKSDRRSDFNNDKSDRRSNYGNDQSDRRSNYKNDQSDRRSNYDNDNSVTEATEGNGEQKQ